MANARERENRNGTTIGKESRDSPLKIDLAVCTIGARMVRQLVQVATATKTPPKSKTLNRS
jgi:hypothetical protein